MMFYLLAALFVAVSTLPLPPQVSSSRQYLFVSPENCDDTSTCQISAEFTSAGQLTLTVSNTNPAEFFALHTYQNNDFINYLICAPGGKTVFKGISFNKNKADESRETISVNGDLEGSVTNDGSEYTCLFNNISEIPFNARDLKLSRGPWDANLLVNTAFSEPLFASAANVYEAEDFSHVGVSGKVTDSEEDDDVAEGKTSIDDMNGELDAMLEVPPKKKGSKKDEPEDSDGDDEEYDEEVTTKKPRRESKRTQTQKISKDNEDDEDFEEKKPSRSGRKEDREKHDDGEDYEEEKPNKKTGRGSKKGKKSHNSEDDEEDVDDEDRKLNKKGRGVKDGKRSRHSDADEYDEDVEEPRRRHGKKHGKKSRDEDDYYNDEGDSQKKHSRNHRHEKNEENDYYEDDDDSGSSLSLLFACSIPAVFFTFF